MPKNNKYENGPIPITKQCKPISKITVNKAKFLFEICLLKLAKTVFYHQQ